jgi:predicted nucleic acid-binding Zn ribbon protein
VTACSVIANESTSPLPNIHAEFYENIVVVRTKANSVLDATKLFILFLLILLVVYAVLYYFRRRHCIVCQKKLIFNMERCYMCIFVGAYPPDPVLVKALEEKGEQIYICSLC